MHPLLFRIGSFELYTYGLMMALGVLAALKSMDSEAVRNGWNRDRITRIVVVTFLLGLLGARTVYVITRLSDPTVNLWDVAFNPRAGFVYYGGLASSWLFLVGYLKTKGRDMNFWAFIDAAAYAICIGLAIGRIGCLLGGCCFGSHCPYPWGVIMEREPALGPTHPVQLYEFIGLVLMYVWLWRMRARKAYEGVITVLFIGVYAVFRYILEFWRGDLIRGFVIEPYMSTSQFLGVVFLALAVFLHFKLRGAGKKVPANA